MRKDIMCDQVLVGLSNEMYDTIDTLDNHSIILKFKKI